MNKRGLHGNLSKIDGSEMPRNSLSVYLPNGMLQSNHIAARKFRGTAGSVPCNFCLVDSEQEFTLSSYTFDCCRVELFCRSHILLYA